MYSCPKEIEKLLAKSVQEKPIPFTIEEAATRYKMNQEVLRRLCKTGQIKAFKIGSLWRIPIEENEKKVYDK